MHVVPCPQGCLSGGKPRRYDDHRCHTSRCSSMLCKFHGHACSWTFICTSMWLLMAPRSHLLSLMHS
jgi:hypothetical protein